MTAWDECTPEEQARWGPWLSKFADLGAKPGPMRPICSTCGHGWPCEEALLRAVEALDQTAEETA